MGESELLRACGRALYGERWASDLALSLDVSRRTVARWLRGEREPSEGVWEELAALLAARRADCETLCDVLRER